MKNRTAIHLGLAAIVIMTAASGMAEKAPARSAARIVEEGKDGYVLDVDGNPALMTYSVDEQGMAIVDGDMAFGPAKDIARTPEEARKKMPVGPDGAIIYQTQRWPNGRIPYVYATDLPLSQASRAAMDIAINRWNTFSYFTKVTFVPRTTETEYVLLGTHFGTDRAHVGWQAGRVN